VNTHALHPLLFRCSGCGDGMPIPHSATRTSDDPVSRRVLRFVQYCVALVRGGRPCLILAASSLSSEGTNRNAWPSPFGKKYQSSSLSAIIDVGRGNQLHAGTRNQCIQNRSWARGFLMGTRVTLRLSLSRRPQNLTLGIDVKRDAGWIAIHGPEISHSI
jgi:hypothetical protein